MSDLLEKKPPLTLDQIRRARAVDMVDLAASYFPLVKRHREYFALCIFHADRKPSLKFERSRDRYKCFSCGASGDAISLVQAVEGLEFREAVLWLIGESNSNGVEISTPTISNAKAREPGRWNSSDVQICTPVISEFRDQAPESPADESKTARALTIFKETIALPGTIGETYIQRRIGSAMDWPRALRFHPRCGGKFGKAQILEFHPAVVALFRDVRTNEPRAILRTFLKPDGSDRLRDAWEPGRDEGKKAQGPSVGCAIKLSPDEDVTHGLGLCEGIEKSLFLMLRGWRPMWCAAGTSGISEFPILHGIEALTVFADNDENGAGEKSASKCVARWREAGREARAIKPRGTKDWDDFARCSA